MTQNNLMERIDALVKEYGSKWKSIAEMLHSEGFTQRDGSPLTVDTLRKRYKRWIGQPKATSNQEKPQSREDTDTGTETVPEAKSQLIKAPRKTGHTAEAMVPVSELVDLFKESLERRDQMLAQRLKADDEKRSVQDGLSSIQKHLEEKLLKTLKEELNELAADVVDRELKMMVSPGGSFERDLKPLIVKLMDKKTSDQLVSLLDEIGTTHEHRGGPGRGHKGEKMARFSATMDTNTYTGMKNLQGTFSSHLTAACRLYLRALEAKREHTD
jgi:hypothetical protein